MAGDDIETSAEMAENAVLPRRHEVHADGAAADDVPQALTRQPILSLRPR